ncbi:MAG: hypothetical protein ACPHCJ_12345, partial [Oceanococcaceae bacterium]
MKLIQTSTSLLLLSLVAACGDSSAGDTAAASCLLEHREKPCNLLTPALLQAFTPQGAELEAEESNYGSPSCTYNWEGGRERTFSIGAMSMTAPMPDSASLSGIRRLNEEIGPAKQQFANMYRPRTEAELEQQRARAAETAERVAKEQSGGNERIEKAAAEAATSMFGTQTWELVDGVGDAAAWGGFGKMRQLHVLSGSTEFVLTLDRNNEESARRADAVQ